MKISIIIRTLNESTYIGELLESIYSQRTTHEIEVVIVDSGSTDGTLAIVGMFPATLVTIAKEEFTFGRSLNMGCEASKGDYLAFISGHCVPVGANWLAELAAPLDAAAVDYCYGKQQGRDTTRFSESLVFQKYYPDESDIPQAGFYCNNANAIVRRELWERFRFNENLTGLEDMYLAKQLVVAGHRVGYSGKAAVFHIHDETWSQIKTRYQRESIALREIMPEVYLSRVDLIVCIVQSVFLDYAQMFRKHDYGCWAEIVAYRCCQYWGSYLGSHEHRQITRTMKYRYFYPLDRIEGGED
jgi:rhamnosyltransferase